MMPWNEEGFGTEQICAWVPLRRLSEREREREREKHKSTNQQIVLEYKKKKKKYVCMNNARACDVQ